MPSLLVLAFRLVMSSWVEEGIFPASHNLGKKYRGQGKLDFGNMIGLGRADN